MLRVVPLEAAHLATLKLQPMQSDLPIAADHADRLREAGPAFAGLDESGRCVAAAGVVPQWEGRAVAWALIAFDAGPYMLAVTRAVRAFLDSCGFERVEASVAALFPASLRWIEMLGFECETPEPMRRYAPGGRACYLYARIRP